VLAQIKRGRYPIWDELEATRLRLQAKSSQKENSPVEMKLQYLGKFQTVDPVLLLFLMLK
jgi:hypothetical protein